MLLLSSLKHHNTWRKCGINTTMLWDVTLVAHRQWFRFMGWIEGVCVPNVAPEPEFDTEGVDSWSAGDSPVRYLSPSLPARCWVCTRCSWTRGASPPLVHRWSCSKFGLSDLHPRCGRADRARLISDTQGDRPSAILGKTVSVSFNTPSRMSLQTVEAAETRRPLSVFL